MSLAGYGSGKAIVSASSSNVDATSEFLFQIKSNQEDNIFALDGVKCSETHEFQFSCVSGTIHYDEQTQLTIMAYSKETINELWYNYSILLIPDE